jgi:hypothetical protein
MRFQQPKQQLERIDDVGIGDRKAWQICPLRAGGEARVLAVEHDRAVRGDKEDQCSSAFDRWAQLLVERRECGGL